jgi:hypothetical protein
MEDLLRFLETYEIWIYVLLGVFCLWYLRKVLVAWHEWRAAIFGLERETAQRRFSSAMTVLMLLFMIGLAQFLLISFVAPDMPRANIIATPTINYFTTPIATLSTTLTPAGQVAGIIPTLAVSGQDGCAPGKLEWTFPKNGAQLSGVVDLKGTVQVANLGFYKFEYSSAGSDNWITIAAGNTPITDSALGGVGSGAWNTSQLVPGDYRLRLVVADNQNQSLPACIINIRVVSP